MNLLYYQEISRNKPNLRNKYLKKEKLTKHQNDRNKLKRNFIIFNYFYPEKMLMLMGLILSKADQILLRYSNI